MMEYITRQPRALTAAENRLLRSITAAGWWSVDARCQTFEDQEALEFLWRSGYIERKAYGGWGVKGNVKPPQEAIESITVGPLCVVVIFADGTHARHRAGTPEYDAYKAQTRGMGKGVTLAGRDGCLAFGNVDRLLGKWKVGG